MFRGIAADLPLFWLRSALLLLENLSARVSIIGPTEVDLCSESRQIMISDPAEEDNQTLPIKPNPLRLY
ncbi:hypothetical protein AFLA_002977 [Aspergillus flavus NRRL3357]|nr:hypothetical protein AFLA_002977 [Aspergillus flavus NRRL3357]